MMRALIRGSVICAWVGLVAGCAAGVDAPSEENTAGTSEALATEGIAGEGIVAETGEFTFFLASRAPGGFAVRALNGRRQRCADGRTSDTCFVTAIDLAPTLLGAKDAAAVLSEIDRNAQRATIAFVGRLGSRGGRSGRGGFLTAWEVWRAPEPRYLLDNWLHVSHCAEQALLVNHWAESSVARIDFGWSPTMEHCHLVDGAQTCEQSHEGVMEDAEAPAGLLIDGWRDGRGVVRVNQYFLKVNVGQARLPNGFWYCRADQTACENGDCVPAPEVCDYNTGHGRGLLVYARTSAPVVQPWFVDTAQLTLEETRQGLTKHDDDCH
jgi:hypothetical protein